MTFRFLTKCNICNYKSLIKVQAGFVEESPVEIGCPNCGSLFEGKLSQIPPNVDLELSNTNFIDGSELPEDVTIIPLSTELPIPKESTEIVSKEGSGFSFSPYLSFSSNLSFEKIDEFKYRYLNFEEYKKRKISHLENLVLLFQRRKYDLVMVEAQKNFKDNIDISKII